MSQILYESPVTSRRLNSELPRAATEAPPARMVSLDAYRGLVMVLMVSAGLGIHAVAASLEHSGHLGPAATRVWRFLGYETEHSEWVGCSLWDLIQPSFMFVVGVALPFSIASRRAKGQSFGRMLFHAAVRSVVLIFLGIFLVSWGRTNWTFETVLTQIGLGYLFLFLIAWTKPSWQVAAAVVVLVGYWAAFAMYPAPSPQVESTKIGLPAEWPRLQGFQAHWEKNTNLAARADQWYLNLFPQKDDKPYVYNRGGYTTLNFVPSLGTMILGLLAGGVLRSRRTSQQKFATLFIAGVAGLVIGWGLELAGVCPVVKRIWTPSWAIYSAGWAFLLLSLFYWAIDIKGYRAWSMPLVVVGMNSIAAYCISMRMRPWVRETVHTHLGEGAYNVFGMTWAPMLETSVFLLFVWGICWWMYHRRLFLKI